MIMGIKEAFIHWSEAMKKENDWFTLSNHQFRTWE